jgi:hypothetical protein
MPDWLSALLASPLVIGALTFAWRAVTRALAERAAAATSRVKADVLRINAETERMLAEARMRESQARITESDATALRDAFAAARKELADAREEIRNVLQANEEERLGRARAEETAMQMHRDFHAFKVEARAGRVPRHTPPSFARFDNTQPYGVTR